MWKKVHLGTGINPKVRQGSLVPERGVNGQSRERKTEHESWFSEYLGGGPSSHLLRRRESRPFVSRFLG